MKRFDQRKKTEKKIMGTVQWKRRKLLGTYVISVKMYNIY